MELDVIIGDYHTFLKNFLDEVQNVGIDLSDCAQLDHIGYAIASFDKYENKKKKLSTIATLLAEPHVGGRPIAVFRLHQPIIFKNWRIDCVELTAPKPDAREENGLNHGEFVIFDDLDSFLHKYEQIQFDLRSIKRKLNPEVGLQLTSSKVKFHLLSIAAVAYFRKELGFMRVD